MRVGAVAAAVAAAAGAAVAIGARGAAACAVTVNEWTEHGADRWCAAFNVTAETATLAVDGIRVEAPGFPGITQRSLDDIRTGLVPADPVCDLVPVGLYTVAYMAGNGTLLCSADVRAPERPITTTPELISTIPLSRSQTSVSFYVRVPNQTALITHLLVEWVDVAFNITHRVVWSGSAIVRTVQAGIPGVVHRTFIATFGGPVFANTEYHIRAAVAHPNGTQATPFTDTLVASTLPGVQPRPTQPTITDLDNGSVWIVPNIAREAGNTTATEFLIVRDVPDDLRNEIVANISCSGLCPGGIVFRASSFTKFVSVVVVNTLGRSAPSDTATISRVVTIRAEKNDALTDSELAGVVVGATMGFLALLVLLVLAWRHTNIITVEIARPAPIDGIEVNADQVRRGKELGAGSTSVVYSGWMMPPDTPHTTPETTGVRVAIKQMRSGISSPQIEGFFGEVDALARLEHPNLIRLLGAVTQSGPVLVLTEFCTHGSLDDYLRAEDPLPDQLWAWAAEMALAVRYIHSENIIHRDIACRNFLINEDFRIKMCDLGMCKALDYSAQYRQHTDISVAVRWAAPISLFNGTFNRGTDVWSLCASYYELYTNGTVPFAAIKTYKAVYEAIITGERLRVPNRTPTVLAAVIDHVWTTTHLDTITMEVFAPAFPVMHIEPVEVRISIAGASV